MFQWRTYLDLARVLHDSPPDGVDPEAVVRAAISRMYYAGFCCSRNYAVRQLGFHPSGSGDDHSGLRRHLRERNKRPLAGHLADLQGWRSQSDYDDEVENLEILIVQARETTETIMRILGNQANQPAAPGA